MKVGDFGLAEDIYSTGYVRESSKTVKIPFKWMPPESLEEGLFSEKSDVVNIMFYHTVQRLRNLILFKEANNFIALCRYIYMYAILMIISYHNADDHTFNIIPVVIWGDMLGGVHFGQDSLPCPGSSHST